MIDGQGKEENVPLPSVCTLYTQHKTDKSRIFNEKLNHNSIKIHTCIHYNKKCTV